MTYSPPVSTTFGLSESDPVIVNSSYSVELPRLVIEGRPSLSERLSVYDEDEYSIQQRLLIGGFLFPPFWFVGAILLLVEWLRTKSPKTEFSKWGRRNVLLSAIFTLLMTVYFVVV